MRKLVAALSSLAVIAVHAQDGTPFEARLTVRVDAPGAIIDKNVYGQFAEHLGRLIYDGIWVGEGSPIPNTRGIRNDVLAALGKLRIPVLRWPGGCFAEEYHWRDGIGPRAQRPRRENTSWGGVETNAFGTHEFMDLVELLGADAYVNGNVASGTPQEMADWIEYMTSDSGSELANLRRANGRDRPWKVRFFGVGNEPWGCGGNMRPEYYADEYKRFATFIHDRGDNRVLKIAAGAHDTDYRWTEVLVAQAAKQIDAISMHYYTLPTGNWQRKGSATAFGEDEWRATLARTLQMDELIRGHVAILDRYDPQKRIALAVDEWGTWYDKEPGPDRGALYQQNTLRDALVAALNLDIFNRHADRVRLANIAQMVNVLQALVLTDGDKIVLTPTYHVFDMYRVHQGATSIPVEIAPGARASDDRGAVPPQASASRDARGVLHVSIVNLEPRRPARVHTDLSGARARKVSGVLLTGPALNAMNTFERPSAVTPARFTGATVAGGGLELNLPPRSVVVLEVRD